MADKIIYRKMKSGKEFMRVKNERSAISIFFFKTNIRISYITHEMTIGDYIDDEVAMPSNESEFNEAYASAISTLKLEVEL